MATRLSQYRAVAPARIDQRAHPRHRLHVTRAASVRKKGNAPLEAALHDLSSYGCRLILTGKFEEGQGLWLQFQNALPIAATVMWSDGEHVGCRFETPIERTLMRSLTLGIC